MEEPIINDGSQITKYDIIYLPISNASSTFHIMQYVLRENNELFTKFINLSHMKIKPF